MRSKSMSALTIVSVQICAVFKLLAARLAKSMTQSPKVLWTTRGYSNMIADTFSGTPAMMHWHIMLVDASLKGTDRRLLWSLQPRAAEPRWNGTRNVGALTGVNVGTMNHFGSSLDQTVRCFSAFRTLKLVKKRRLRSLRRFQQNETRIKPPTAPCNAYKVQKPSQTQKLVAKRDTISVLLQVLQMCFNGSFSNSWRCDASQQAAETAQVTTNETSVLATYQTIRNTWIS